MRFWTRSGISGFKAKSTSTRINGSLRTRVVFVPGSRSSRSSLVWCPSYVITSAVSTSLAMNPPKAAAFIVTAPPTVPGIPLANSRPERPLSAASLHTDGKSAPAPHRNIPSPKRLTCEIVFAIFITTPLIPSSLTKRLVPAPMIWKGTCMSDRILMSANRSGISSGTTRTSAGPPMRNEVWRDIGSSAYTCPRTLSFSCTARVIPSTRLSSFARILWPRSLCCLHPSLRLHHRVLQDRSTYAQFHPDS